jgi:hypothetical protein
VELTDDEIRERVQLLGEYDEAFERAKVDAPQLHAPAATGGPGCSGRGAVDRVDSPSSTNIA